MHCTACVMRLEGLDDELPGIRQVRASYQGQQLEVEFDAAQATETQIQAAAAKMGYALMVAPA